MRWALVLAVAAVALRPEAEARPRRCSTDRISRQVVCDSGVPTAASAAPAAPYSFCDAALVAGNRVGTWGCVNGDGTAPSGDNLGPWVVSGSPSSTSGTTCASPSYKTLHLANPAERYESTAEVAAAPSAFSWCALYEASSTLTAAFFWGDFPCCGGAGYSVTVEQGATLIQYFNPDSVNSGVTVATEKTLVCGAYGGGAQAFYVRNSALGSVYTTGAATLTTAAGRKITFGADSNASAARVVGKFFGGFYTEKQMAQADFDAIYVATVGGGCT